MKPPMKEMVRVEKKMRLILEALLALDDGLLSPQGKKELRGYIKKIKEAHHAIGTWIKATRRAARRESGGR